MAKTKWRNSEDNEEDIFSVEPGDPGTIVIGGDDRDNSLQANPFFEEVVNFFYGHGGNDLILAGGGIEIYSGGEGKDTVTFSNRLQGITANLARPAYYENYAIFSSIENLTGSDFNDSLTGNSEDNILRGQAGADLLSGGAGKDTIYGGSAKDELRGGLGEDTLRGGRGGDTLFGGRNKDLLSGGAGQNNLHGGRGDDQLVVNNPYNDRVNGGLGFDTLTFALKDQYYDLGGLSADQYVSIEYINLNKNSVSFNAAQISRFNAGGDVILSNGTASITDAQDWYFQGFRSANGQTYRVYGSAASGSFELMVGADATTSPLSNSIDLAHAINAVRIDGFAAPLGMSITGRSVAGGGDVNGDGYADILIGAPGTGRFVDGDYIDATGGVYVLFGGPQGVRAANLGRLWETNGIVIRGDKNSDNAGFSVAPAGDVNGDGIADIVIGAVGANSERGAAYIVFGRSGGFAPNTDIHLATLTPDQGVRIFNSKDAAGGIPSLLGYSVSSAGDVNGDGYADVLIGAPFEDRVTPYNGTRIDAGGAYLIYGSATGLGVNGTLDLGHLSAAQGVHILGQRDYERAAYSVAGLGDVNGDGRLDIAVTIPQADGVEHRTGAAYILFGQADGFGSDGVLRLNRLGEGEGVRVLGANTIGGTGGRLGISIASAGDVNGDGIKDIIIGADRDEGVIDGAPVRETGSVYVLFGRTDLAESQILDLTNFSGADGIHIIGKALESRIGFIVSSAGDFNNDGFDDIIIGSAWEDRTGANPGESAGASYLLFGHAGGFGDNGTIRLSELLPEQGFEILGASPGDRAGYVSAAGDVNKDGYDDLLIGAYEASYTGPRSGSAYVLYGGNYEPAQHIPPA